MRHGSASSQRSRAARPRSSRIGPILGSNAADAEGRVDFRQPVRRLNAAEALALLRPPPVPKAEPAQPEVVAQPGGWLAALLASLTVVFSRS